MNEEKANRCYELGYLIVPTVPETDVDKEVATLKGAIEKEGGTFHSEGHPEFIDLAYTIEKTVSSKKYKYAQGYFGWIKFTADPSALEAIKKSLDANLSLIRYILIKTSVENTVIFKKPKGEAKRETVLTEEEMDALIDATDAPAPSVADDAEDAQEHEKLPDLSVDLPADPADSNKS
ncbi:MAG TPA: 30S ribosomal protein S6 [Candidatus Paceibacterota bacterium]|nr:30S ribosomal protein S6 [Candidatus Paceibacterota bacterium]